MHKKTYEAKQALIVKARKLNKLYIDEGIPDRYLIDIGMLEKIGSADDLQKATRIVNINETDKPTKIGNIYLRQAEVRYYLRTQREANQRLKQREREKEKAKREAYSKWGYTDYKETTQKERPEYTKKVTDFKDYEKFVDYIRQLNINRNGGLYTDELKEAILKALRGEVYQQANGYKMIGGIDNPLAKFVEKELSGNEVNILFGGKLNFEFIYSHEEGAKKEMEMLAEIWQFPALRERFIQGGYQKEYDDYFEQAYNLDGLETETEDIAEAKEMRDIIGDLL